MRALRLTVAGMCLAAAMAAAEADPVRIDAADNLTGATTAPIAAPPSPTKPARPDVPADRILVTGPTGGDASVTAEALAKLPAVSVTVSFGTEGGQHQASFQGPLLWDVLAQTGAIDASRRREQVRAIVLIEGRDGYTAALAVGEIAPDFEGKQVILAERMDGRPLEPGHWRIIVPADRRGGRSVRDVARIAVTPPP